MSGNSISREVLSAAQTCRAIARAEVARHSLRRHREEPMTALNPGAAPATPRLPLLDEATDPVVAKILDDVRTRTGRLLNLHRMMAHAPGLMKASYDTAMVVRHELSLPRPLVELAIMRTAQLANSDYEWHQHYPMALANGRTAEQIAALGSAQTSPLFNEAEKVALAWCEAVAMGSDPAPGDFERLQRHYDSRQIVELTMLVAEYLATARVIRALGIPIETPN
jgi:alkylhydroperoxidase family enzyme